MTARAGLLAACLAASCLIVACGASPTQPTPPPAPPPTTPEPTPPPTPDPIPQLRITCPADIDTNSRDGNPVIVNYAAPSTEGGSSPVSVTCAPPSGSAFPTGTTTVTCTATDAAGQSASCSLRVTVRPPPRISVTKFLAFGDSMTEGIISLSAPSFALVSSASYPSKLETALANRYTAQTITVTNAGKAGEHTPDGRTRLPGVLGTYKPEVLLLMEGVNDLNTFHEAAVDRVLDNLEAMIKEGHRRGARVMVATLPPQRPGGRRAGSAQLIQPFNDQLRRVVAEERAILVDVYAALASDLSLIGSDGLHPTEAGYQRIADTFFEKIKETFEVGR